MEGKGRIFIVGSPRSGTSLVESVVASHKDVIGFRESHFFSHGFWAIPALFGIFLRRKSLPSVFERFTRYSGLGTEEERKKWIESLEMTQDSVAAARWFVRFLDEFAAREGKLVWAEKSPSHILFVPLLKKVAPDALFIHVLRNPLDTTRSFHTANAKWEHWELPHTHFAHAEHKRTILPHNWITQYFFCRSMLKRSARYINKKNHYMLFYEKLVENPKAETERLISWLGLPRDPDMESRRRSNADHVVGKEEQWKANVFHEIGQRTAYSNSIAPSYLRALASYDHLYDWFRKATIHH